MMKTGFRPTSARANRTLLPLACAVLIAAIAIGLSAASAEDAAPAAPAVAPPPAAAPAPGELGPAGPPPGERVPGELPPGEPAPGAVAPGAPAVAPPAAPGAAPTLPAAAATVPAAVTQPAALLTAPGAATAPAAATTPVVKNQSPLPQVPDGTPISLNFSDAPVRSVLEYISESAGLTVIVDTPVDGRITVISRKNISVEEAVSLLDTVLRQKGYAAIRIGKTLKIVTVEQARKELVPVRTGNDPNQITPSDRIITQVIPIRFADATKLKADLATLIPASTDVASNVSSNTLIVTGTEATVRRLVEIISAIDVHMSEVTQVKVFQLKYANASSAAKLITDIFKPDQQTQGMAQFNRRAFMMPGQPATTEDQRTTKVTASADDRTNTLVVSASPEVLTVIEGMIKELDANPAEQQAVFIYRLKNGQAKNVEGVLNTTFGWSSGGGVSTSTSRQNAGYGGTTSAFSSRTGNTSGRNTGSTNNNQRTTNRNTSGNRNISAGTAAAASDLAGQVYIVADEDTNSLVVTTASKNFDRVKGIIADLDRAVPQVLIKVLIAEVTHGDELDLGVEFSGMDIGRGGRGPTAGTNFNVAANTTGFTFNLEERDVTAAVRALAKVSKLDVLSRPYILTSDNQQATIMVGQEVPFITNTRTTDTGQTINTIEYDDIGIILNVTPHINPQGLVTLDVAPEISTLTGETVPISETVSAPVFAKRSAQSRVAIRDGQTIVIGGLMEDRNTTTINKVPLLGDIPLLGALFRRSEIKKTKTELLIFLTPHVALQPDELKEMSESEKAGTKAVQDAVSNGALEEHLKGMERGGVKHAPEAEPSSNRPADKPAAPPTKPADSKPAAKPDADKPAAPATSGQDEPAASEPAEAPAPASGEGPAEPAAPSPGESQ